MHPVILVQQELVPQVSADIQGLLANLVSRVKQDPQDSLVLQVKPDPQASLDLQVKQGPQASLDIQAQPELVPQVSADIQAKPEPLASLVLLANLVILVQLGHQDSLDLLVKLVPLVSQVKLVPLVSQVKQVRQDSRATLVQLVHLALADSLVFLASAVILVMMEQPVHLASRDLLDKLVPLDSLVSRGKTEPRFSLRVQLLTLQPFQVVLQLVICMLF